MSSLVGLSEQIAFATSLIAAIVTYFLKFTYGVRLCPPERGDRKLHLVKLKYYNSITSFAFNLAIGSASEGFAPGPVQPMHVREHGFATRRLRWS